MNWQDEIIKRDKEPLAPIFKNKNMAKQQKLLWLDSTVIEKAKALINKRELKLNFSQFITDLILKEYNNEKSKGI